MKTADPCVHRIIELLENRGVKQKFIPQLLGKAEYSSLVTDWKNGKSKPSDRDLEIIASNYGVSAHWLKTGDAMPQEKMLTRITNTDEQEVMRLFAVISDRDKGIILETLRRMAESVPGEEKERCMLSEEQAG